MKDIKNIVLFSGGKDSTAMLLRMIELDYKIDDIVFADTQLEYPEIYDYIKKIEKFIKRKIIVVTGDSWDKWFYGKYIKGKHKGEIRGFPYTAFMSWCTRELKINPVNKICKGNIIYLGIAYDEKHRIQNNNKIKYPLIDWKWTEKDRSVYLIKKGLENPLYNKFKRLGCWCCPKQSIPSLRILYNDYPELWGKLLNMEKYSPIKFKPDYTVQQLDLRFENEKKQLKCFK